MEAFAAFSLIPLVDSPPLIPGGIWIVEVRAHPGFSSGSVVVMWKLWRPCCSTAS